MGTSTATESRAAGELTIDRNKLGLCAVEDMPVKSVFVLQSGEVCYRCQDVDKRPAVLKYDTGKVFTGPQVGAWVGTPKPNARLSLND